MNYNSVLSDVQSSLQAIHRAHAELAQILSDPDHRQIDVLLAKARAVNGGRYWIY